MSDLAVDTNRWRKMLLRCHIVIVLAVLVIEIVDCILLHLTGVDGWGWDNFGNRLFRYVVLTSIINFGSLLASFVITRFVSKKYESYILLFCVSVVCINVTVTHYQFANCFAIVNVPILISILYQKKSILRFTMFINLIGLGIATYCRAVDDLYNRSIVPESVITIVILFAVYYFCEFTMNVMIKQQTAFTEMAEIRQKNIMMESVEKEKEQFKKLSEETFVALAKAVDVNDVYTAGHSQRVANYSKELAIRLNMTDDEIWEVYYAGLLHDVGKLGIDNNIINKPSKLTDEEFAEIKRHPEMGYAILKGISIQGNFALGAKYHHERYDGRGYPEGLSGEDIPLIGRIIAVADAYDAMTSSRAYRQLMKQADVRAEIENGKGKQFDSAIADIMLSIMDADVEYALHQ